MERPTQLPDQRCIPFKGRRKGEGEERGSVREEREGGGEAAKEGGGAWGAREEEGGE